MSYVAKVFTVIDDLPLPVAPHVTVVRVGCDTNRGPAIRLLASINVNRGGQPWTPQPHAAPIWPALSEGQLASCEP
jgi:hypothetical protein